MGCPTPPAATTAAQTAGLGEPSGQRDGMARNEAAPPAAAAELAAEGAKPAARSPHPAATAAPAAPTAVLAAAEAATRGFPLSTPMLVMPLATFKVQGRIVKSVKAWRDEALRKGWLIVHDSAAGKVVIFLSHTWWDREFLDPDRDPNDPYDKGAPDYQSGEKKDLKWRVICSGVHNLVQDKGLKEEDVVLWIDWQSIYQDDKAEKSKGVESLIKYATLSDYMLVPMQKEVTGNAAKSPMRLPAYGERGWCRCEFFIFSLLAEMRGREVELYAISPSGALNRYPTVAVGNPKAMPSGGALSNPDDKKSVEALEDRMIEAYGKALVAIKCVGGDVDLSKKMLRAVHMDALGDAMAKIKVRSLDLSSNQLQGEGLRKLAAVVQATPTLTTLTVDGHALQIDELKGTKPTETIDLSDKGLSVASAFIIASCIMENGVLKELNVSKNGITGDAADNLAKAVLEHAAMTSFCEIPLISLRENSITELDLERKGIGVPGAIVLSKLLPSVSALVTLNLRRNDLCGLNYRGEGIYTAEAILELCEALKESAVTSLSIESNYLGAEGGKAFKAFAAVLKDTQLTNLNLRNNDLTNNGKDMTGVLQLADALPQTKLVSLNLLYNDLNDEAKEAIRQAVAGRDVELAL